MVIYLTTWFRDSLNNNLSTCRLKDVIRRIDTFNLYLELIYISMM